MTSDVSLLRRNRALLALGADLDAPGKERLRSMLDATADPDFKTLLEVAAEEADEAQLSRALSRLTKP